MSQCCSHCGLPVLGSARASGDQIFCCYGCYLASRIVGQHDEQTSRPWTLLRLCIGALLAMNVMMLSLLLYTGSVEAETVPVFHWIMLALATPAMLILGYPFAAAAVGDLRRGRLSLDSLIALGSIAAYAVSAANTIRGIGHVYYDTATMLPTLVTFGKLLEATAKARSSRLLLSLQTLLPEVAHRLSKTDGAFAESDVPLSALCPDDRLRVRPGERVPVDGCILDGATSIDQAAFTGESQPRICEPGDLVYAGTINGPGSVIVRADRVGLDILLRRIIDMVEQARRQPASYERLADKASAVFVPIVIALAIVAGAIWAWGDDPAKGALVALSILVVACPCALGIATPLATALAIGRAARSGVIVRGGDVLERIGKIDAVYFDKTGTLTMASPVVMRIEVHDPSLTRDELLGWLAALEAASEHSLARGIAVEAARRGLPPGFVSDFRTIPGQGIEGRVSWQGQTHEVKAGSALFVAEEEELGASGITIESAKHGRASPAVPPLLSEILNAEAGASSIFIGWEGLVRGRILMEDSLRENADDAVAGLKALGVGTALLSGDRPEAARSIASRVGIETIHAPCLPSEKLDIIADAVSRGSEIAMVGDGINDAPALAAAPVGIALGAGTDLARQAGNVVLLSNRLDQIPWLIRLGRRTRRVTVQNLVWAFGYNALSLSAAAAGLLHPLIAAVLMVVSSLTLLTNSLRLQRFPEG